jgi:hypothetical protein
MRLHSGTGQGGEGKLVATDKEKLRTQAMFLVGDTYVGEIKKHVFNHIKNALDQGLIHFEELGIAKEQWVVLEKEFIEVEENLPIEKMSESEAKDLARTFGVLWREIQEVKEEEHKEELVILLKNLWPRINHAISTHLIATSDLSLERATQYFEIQALIHKDDKAKK